MGLHQFSGQPRRGKRIEILVPFGKACPALRARLHGSYRKNDVVTPAAPTGYAAKVSIAYDTALSACQLSFSRGGF